MASIQKEKRIRARVEGIYNKKEGDFPSRVAYDDYLEEREEIIYNLVEGIDVEAMERKIASYQRENKESILINEARKAEEARARAETASRGRTPADITVPAAEYIPEPQSIGDIPAYTATTALPVAPAPAQPAPRHETSTSLADAARQQRASDDQGAGDGVARASGWDPNWVRDRLLQEAYGTIFPEPSPACPQLVQ